MTSPLSPLLSFLFSQVDPATFELAIPYLTRFPIARYLNRQPLQIMGKVCEGARSLTPLPTTPPLTPPMPPVLHRSARRLTQPIISSMWRFGTRRSLPYPPPPKPMRPLQPPMAIGAAEGQPRRAHPHRAAAGQTGRRGRCHICHRRRRRRLSGRPRRSVCPPTLPLRQRALWPPPRRSLRVRRR